MVGHISRGFLDELERRRDAIRRATENMLLEARDQGRQTLSEGEDRRYRQARSDLIALDERIAEYLADLERSRIPARLSRLSPTNHRPLQGTL